LKSINFEFLREKWPELVGLAGYAEHYAHSDPSSALIKLRNFVEFIVLNIYSELNLPKPIQPNLNDLLNLSSFKDAIPRVVNNKLHGVRINGNKAAHGEKLSTVTALWLIREAYDIAKWYFVTYANGSLEACPEFQKPPETSLTEESKAELKRQKRGLLEKLAAQETQMQELLNKLENERGKAKAVEQDLEKFKAKAQSVADELSFDEATTRNRLIDSQLVAAGWDVGPDGQNTKEVTQEEEVQHQPTPTGLGYADYVLWDDNGKPLAVIEAKKTAESPEKGRNQARLYADGLEKMHDQRPVIFYTNGFEISIWDDAQGYPPRHLYGFYSKDSLQYLVNYQREEKKPLDSIMPQRGITDRNYQQRGIKEVLERFSDKHRKALVAQATGTGKTRVAISLTDILIRASWVKRVLFLCDRKELRKQAKNVFNDFLSSAPLVIVKSSTAKDRDKRIYLGTYPAMMKVYQSFDVGFFDLIIADESHRSIYNRYREIFQYFDCLQVGLTATPVDFVGRNTFRMFDCEERNPTAHYSYEDGVEEGFLVPFEVYTHTTQFLRSGIKYADLTKEQKQQLEEDGEDPELFDYEAQEIDKRIYNKDTNRLIIRNLMENGIKDAAGQHPGKTIIFARNHNHAMLLQGLFNEMYPQYGGKFCQVIDTYDPRAEQLIDDFKDKDNLLTVAISVDMLDTGIDVLEIVNLVFAKPIKSYVKFWQMIGRGTRICQDLFGPGHDKKAFRIFDHWQNFEYFDMRYRETEPTPSKSLMQKVFKSRVDLAETALNNQEMEVFKFTTQWIGQAINSLDEGTIAVKEKWREKRTVSKPETLNQFSPNTITTLRNEMAPLMQWVNIRGQGDAYNFDLLVTNAQIELLRNSGHFDDLKGTIINQVTKLPMHLNPVREKTEVIKKVKSKEFWNPVTVGELEEIRKDLRGIMQYLPDKTPPPPSFKVVDVSDGEVRLAHRPTNLSVVDEKIYKNRVAEALKPLFDTNPTLIKIRKGESVSSDDLSSLTSLVLIQHPDIDLSVLQEFYAQTALPLDFLIRSIVGMESDSVKERFTEFTRQHPEVTAQQTRFLGMLQNHISQYGSIEIEKLYEAPFINLDSEGLDGVFPEEKDVNELIQVIQSFKPSQMEENKSL